MKITFALSLPDCDDHRIGRMLVVRGLGVIGMIAFASLATQIVGLVGERGILPAARLVTLVGERHTGLDRLLEMPGLHWIFGASDTALLGYCAAGFVTSLLVALAVAPGPLLVLDYLLYLTLCALGQIFMGYQWDALLCEAFVLGALFAPWRPLGFIRRAPIPTRWPMIVSWVLVVRLTMGSGLSKLLSGDETWRNMSALAYHFETQPLPTPLALYAHRLPEFLQYATCATMFAIQLLLPICLFLGRRPRHFAVFVMALLQLLIGLTGNYNFFNLLTILLSLSAIDDDAFRALLPARIAAKVDELPAHATRAGLIITAVLSIALGVVGITASIDRLLRDPLPGPFAAVLNVARPFELATGYGLFAVMTTKRDEIELEATIDGTTWKPYVFRAKPGPEARGLPWVQPHQPRLDWQMWFAALGSIERNRWLDRLMLKLLEGEPTVVGLFETVPFEQPIAIRAMRYRYLMAPIGAGQTWTRQDLALYAGPIEKR